MKFGSSVTFFKRFIIKGTALSLIWVAGAEAAIHTVTSLNDDNTPGTLRSAIAAANQDLDANRTVQFSNALGPNATIPVSSLITIVRPMTIDAITGAPANLTIGSGWTSPLFNITPTAQLALNGKADVAWFGSMTNDGKLIFRQDQSINVGYNGNISGFGSVEILTFGTPGAVPVFNWLYGTNTYTGGTTISSSVLVPVGDNAFPSTGNLNLLATPWVGGGGPGGIFVLNNFTRTISGLSGGGQLNISNAGTLILNSNINSIFSGIVDQNGNFIKLGTGITEFTGVNTFAGALRVNEGGIKISAGQWNSPVEVTGINGSIPTLFVSGGTMTKTVEVNTNGRLQVSGGTIQQAVTVNADGICQISGGTLADQVNVNANGGLEITGGTITGPVNVNENGLLNLNGGGAVGDIDIAQGGNALLTNATALTVQNVTNNGTLTNADMTTPFNIQGGFTQGNEGVINISIESPTEFSRFAVTGNATLGGGVINISPPSTTAIDKDTTFDIMNNIQAGAVLPKVPLNSLFIKFTPSLYNGDTLRLTVDREPYQAFNDVPALAGIAKQLDDLIDDDKFNPVLGTIDQIESKSEYEDVLAQLAPTGLDGVYTAAAENLSGGADQAFLRLDTARAMGTTGALARTGYIRTGYAAGDMMENQGSYGPIVFGNSTKQDNRAGLAGYNATTAGFGFLGDVPILDYYRVGLGITYASSSVKQSNNTGSNTKIGSTQGMAYGSATYGPLFLDGVLSAGVNSYTGKRNMPAFGQTATSNYHGFQYGAKAKTGFTIPIYQAEISPTAGVQYMHLNVGQYTEKGAGILNQSVSSIQTSNVRVSLGARIADRSQEEDFFPEIHAFYLVDVKNPQVTITSRFVAGGGSFESKSAVPPKAGINVGASLTALLTDSFVISGGYDLEAKKSFRSHSASLKFKFLF